jgi:hypothetical protein
MNDVLVAGCLRNEASMRTLSRNKSGRVQMKTTIAMLTHSSARERTEVEWREILKRVELRG